MIDTNYVEIGKTRDSLLSRRWIINPMVVNIPEQQAQIPQTLDGTKHYLNIDEYIRPKVSFTYNFKNATEYSIAEQILLHGTFVMRYYNYSIEMWCIGKFKLTNSSRQKFIRMAGNNYIGVANYSIEAESIYTYTDWTELKQKAESDDRIQ